MRISFTIYGQPVGKGRPKFSGRYGNTRHAYTPKKTREYEENVKASFLSRFGMLPFKKDAKLCVEIHAWYQIPKSKPKQVKENMRLEIIRPTVKPDLDNVIKIIMDSLNGVAYPDDKQVVEIHAIKRYSDDPCVTVMIEEI